MDTMWAPWRIEYILGPKPDSCVFCLGEGREHDKERQVLYRGKHNFVIMNKYPYSNGHIMVAPVDHIADICDLPDETACEFMRLIRLSASVLNKHFHPQGINIGMNIGEAAGAGVREHLHCHLVPRWNGDSNFMTVIGEVRTIPEHLKETYASLLPYFGELESKA